MTTRDKDLESRIDAALRQTHGTMPIGLPVDDEDMAARARALLKGRRHARLIQVRVDPHWRQPGGRPPAASAAAAAPASSS